MITRINVVKYIKKIETNQVRIIGWKGSKILHIIECDKKSGFDNKKSSCHLIILFYYFRKVVIL